MLFTFSPRSIYRRLFRSSEQKPVTKTPVVDRTSPEPATLETIATADRSSADLSHAQPSPSQTTADPQKPFGGRQAITPEDRAELLMFERRFGESDGCRYFVNGLTLHRAYLDHIAKLQAEPATELEGNTALARLCEHLERDIRSGLIQP